MKIDASYICWIMDEHDIWFGYDSLAMNDVTIATEQSSKLE